MARLAILETGLWDVPRNEIIAAETPEIYAENRRHKIPGFSVLIQDKKQGLQIMVKEGLEKGKPDFLE